MKEFFKNIIVNLLWTQVRRLRQKHNPIVIAVAGSIGKTGTKTAIAKVLSEAMKVSWQDGNYNDIVSVPLVFFGLKMPSLLNPFGWLKTLILVEKQIRGAYPYEVVVLEIGTDYKGNMDLFKRYLTADYGVLTGIAPEHMENFKDLDDVADEELVVADISETLLVNTDTVDPKYLAKLVGYIDYGSSAKGCRIVAGPLSQKFKRTVTFELKDGFKIEVELDLIGKQNLPALAAAVLVGSKLELKPEEVKAGIDSVKPLPGRMQLLKGEKGSLLIDDTYNASPEAVIAALGTLYEASAKQKIAILGQMNELGKFSPELHKKVGEMCDPKQLDLLVTLGKDANSYLADVAEKRGCKVMRCPSPYHAADVIRPFIKKGTLILAKGSQNGVFAEESLKELLDNPADASKLVRQSKQWIKIKQGQFNK